MSCGRKSARVKVHDKISPGMRYHLCRADHKDSPMITKFWAFDHEYPQNLSVSCIIIVNIVKACLTKAEKRWIWCYNLAGGWLCLQKLSLAQGVDLRALIYLSV